MKPAIKELRDYCRKYKINPYTIWNYKHLFSPGQWAVLFSWSHENRWSQFYKEKK